MNGFAQPFCGAFRIGPWLRLPQHIHVLRSTTDLRRDGLIPGAAGNNPRAARVCITDAFDEAERSDRSRPPRAEEFLQRALSPRRSDARRCGDAVVTSDLYAQRFDPVSDRRNFTSVFDADYLKQGTEERHATAVDGFAPDLEREIRKLESCDLLVFSFPLWWFAMPAILKGWVDRTFAIRGSSAARACTRTGWVRGAGGR
jgi:Flavodoxin-like fold